MDSTKNDLIPEQLQEINSIREKLQDFHFNSDFTGLSVTDLSFIEVQSMRIASLCELIYKECRYFKPE